MEFIKYNSIENTYREAFVNKVEREGLSGGEWQVTTKIDGANFSFWCDGEQVKIAKRSGFIDAGENFYGCWEIYAQYQQNILDMYSKLCSEGDVMVVYGELFGKGILNRVDYGDGKYFAAFDIRINGALLRADEVFHHCYTFGIPHAPVLYTGLSLEVALASPVDTRDPINPEAEGDNVTEGVVIKPVDPKHISNGSRVIFKKKSKKFLEKESKPNKNKDKDKSLNEGQQKYLSVLSEYVTESRLKSLLSKFGEVTQKDFGKLMGLYTVDVLEDYQKDYSDNPKETTGDDWKGINKALQNEVSMLIRKNFVNIIDGTY